MNRRGMGLASLALLTGCMTATGAATLSRTVLTFGPPAPLEGKWRKVVTPDYTLFTDQGPEEAERAAQLLSQSLVGLSAMFARAPVLDRTRLFVFALRDGMEFERRFGKRISGFTHRNGADGPHEAVICLYGPPDRWFERSAVGYDAKESVLQHELAHAVLRRHFPQQAKWFAEGMAQYLETFRWLDADTVQLGDPKLEAYRSYRQLRSISVKDALEWDGFDPRELENIGLYAMSWAMVHYLRNREPHAFGLYLQTLAQAGPRAAWDVALSPLRDALDAAIFQYMKAGQYQSFTITVPERPSDRVKVVSATADEARVVELRLDAMELEFKRPR
jgi:hypothetical protein